MVEGQHRMWEAVSNYSTSGHVFTRQPGGEGGDLRGKGTGPGTCAW